MGSSDGVGGRARERVLNRVARVRTGAGDLEVRGGGQDLTLSTVSGAIALTTAAPLRRALVETVSGRVAIATSLEPGSTLTADEAAEGRIDEIAAAPAALRNAVRGLSDAQLDTPYRDGGWTPRQKAWVDAFSVFALMFFLGVLLYGGVESTKYALEYGERSYSAWRPYMAPIKLVMCFGILLMLLQAIATFFKDWAEARGEPIA